MHTASALTIQLVRVPSFFFYGCEPRLPVDVNLLPARNESNSITEYRARIVQTLEEARAIARENIQRAQQKMEEIYDRSARDRKFMIGDRVWVCMPKTKKGLSRKLMHHWHGPYRIVEKCSPVHYKLRTCDNRLVSVTVHANRIFTFRHSRERQLIPVLLFQMKNYLPIAFNDYHPVKHTRNSQLESAASDTPESPDTLHNIE